MNTTVAMDKYPKLKAVIAAINTLYEIPRQGFLVGGYQNARGENLGSLAIFRYAQLHGLQKEQILALFGEAYQEVLKSYKGDNHKNIRAFILCNGIDDVVFLGEEMIPLLPEEDIAKKAQNILHLAQSFSHP